MLLSYWGEYAPLAFGSAFKRKELLEGKEYQSVSSGLEEQFYHFSTSNQVGYATSGLHVV
jgi:hypothetical protein